MKKVITLIISLVISVLTFVAPVWAIDKLPKNASLQEAYERILYFQKKLDTVPVDQLDGLQSTIASYLDCKVIQEYAYSSGSIAEELINDAKARHGNVSAQIWCVRYYLDFVLNRGREFEIAVKQNKAKMEAERHGRSLFAYGQLTKEGQQIYSRIKNAVNKEYLDKAVALLHTMLNNPKSSYSTKMWALDKEAWINLNIANDDSWSWLNLSLNDKLNCIDKAKQLFTIEQKTAKNSKDRKIYEEAMHGLRVADRIKKDLLGSQKQEKVIKNFLQ